MSLVSKILIILYYIYNIVITQVCYVLFKKIALSNKYEIRYILSNKI